MRSLFFAAVIILIALSFATGEAAAGPKPWVFGWWPSHWKNLNFEKPYLYEGKLPHNRQWDYRYWQPGDWINQRQSALKLIQDWYVIGIIEGQYMEEDVPVLEVGSAYFDLGFFDRQRVMQTVNYVYEITSKKENGMFRIVDSRNGEYIGLYSRHGLMQQ
jgi:hypothetical protein